MTRQRELWKILDRFERSYPDFPLKGLAFLDSQHFQDYFYACCRDYDRASGLVDDGTYRNIVEAIVTEERLPPFTPEEQLLIAFLMIDPDRVEHKWVKTVHKIWSK